MGSRNCRRIHSKKMVALAQNRQMYGHLQLNHGFALTHLLVVYRLSVALDAGDCQDVLHYDSPIRSL